MRDRLVEIVKSSLMKHIDKSCKLAENITDDLLAEGVIALPCKVGDKIFAVIWAHSLQKNCVTPYIVDELFYSTKRGIRPWVVICFGGKRFDNCDFGKTVFLTREQAEKALAERSDNEN